MKRMAMIQLLSLNHRVILEIFHRLIVHNKNSQCLFFGYS